MDFTVHSIRDIENWVSMLKMSGFKDHLHFHLKKDPNIPDSDRFAHIKGTLANRKRNTPFQRAKRGTPFDWVYNEKTGRYVWKEDITSETKPPKGFKYIGRSESDVWRHYQNGATNGVSRLYRKYLGAPDIDQHSFVNARNEDLKKLIKEIFDAVKRKGDFINYTFDSISIEERGSGEYYRYNSDIGHGIAGITLELEYEGIKFTSLVKVEPPNPRRGIPNSVHYMDYSINNYNPKDYQFLFYGEGDPIGKKNTIITIHLHRDAFKQVYKELFNEEFKGY